MKALQGAYINNGTQASQTLLDSIEETQVSIIHDDVVTPDSMKTSRRMQW